MSEARNARKAKGDIDRHNSIAFFNLSSNSLMHICLVISVGQKQFPEGTLEVHLRPVDPQAAEPSTISAVQRNSRSILAVAQDHEYLPCLELEGVSHLER